MVVLRTLIGSNTCRQKFNCNYFHPGKLVQCHVLHVISVGRIYTWSESESGVPSVVANGPHLDPAKSRVSVSSLSSSHNDQSQKSHGITPIRTLNVEELRPNFANMVANLAPSNRESLL